jgi:hypothetical protein
MNTKHLTTAAVGMALIAVVYAFRDTKAKPVQASATSTFFNTWDTQLASLSLSNNLDQYKPHLTLLDSLTIGKQP